MFVSEKIYKGFVWKHIYNVNYVNIWQTSNSSSLYCKKLDSLTRNKQQKKNIYSRYFKQYTVFKNIKHGNLHVLNFTWINLRSRKTLSLWSGQVGRLLCSALVQKIPRGLSCNCIYLRLFFYNHHSLGELKDNSSVCEL